MIVIDRHSATPFYRQIHRQVVKGIETGAYRMGDRLPSIRSFALELGVSRNTVEQAYLTLMQEGYVHARQGSGYYVNSADISRGDGRPFDPGYDGAMDALLAQAAETDGPCRYDFSCAGVDPESFPYYRWARISREVLLDPGREQVCRPGDPRGLPALRDQVARHLMKERDIVARPEQVLILPSIRSAIAEVLGLFQRGDATVILDDPGCPEIAAAATAIGFETVPHAVFPRFDWKALDAAAGGGGTRIVCTAPAGHCPLNATMPLEDRRRLVDWAAATDSYLIEDGRCHESRYGSSHPPSLHALDAAGRVIALGSFSETLAPSMCLAYLVLPPQLMLRWLHQDNVPAAQVPWQVQATLAAFMEQDLWHGHLRRLQTSCHRKHDAIIAAIGRYLGDAVEYSKQEVGRHVLVRVKDGRGEGELMALARAHGVRVYPTGGYWAHGAPEGWNRVMLGYSAMPLEDIEPGVQALAHAWGL